MAAYAKAIAAGIAALLAFLAQTFDWTLAGWITEDWLNTMLIWLGPVVVYLVPNKR